MSGALSGLIAELTQPYFDACESEPERRFLLAFYLLAETIPTAEFVLPWPDPQFEIGGFCADFAWDGFGLVVEIDGHDAHKSKAQREHDYRRDRMLSRAGWHVMRFTGTEAYHEPERCAREAGEWLRVERNQQLAAAPEHEQKLAPFERSLLP